MFDSVKRTESLTSILRDITDILPFKKADKVMSRDRKLMRYLIFSLPFHESVVESLVNTILYKFQVDLEFLVNFVGELHVILSQNDSSAFYDDINTDRDDYDSVDSLQNQNFDDYMRYSICNDVKVNMTKIKMRALTYFSKVLKIIKIVI